jgi:hypothetical protein
LAHRFSHWADNIIIMRWEFFEVMLCKLESSICTKAFVCVCEWIVLKNSFHNNTIHKIIIIIIFESFAHLKSLPPSAFILLHTH